MVGIYDLFQVIHAITQLWSKYDIIKCWCDLENKVKKESMIRKYHNYKSRSPKSNQIVFPLLTIYLRKFGEIPLVASEDRAQKNADFHRLNMMVGLKVRSRSPKSNKLCMVLQ